MSQIWIQRLENEYKSAFEAYSYGSFQQCISKCRSLIKDYLVLTPGPPTLDIRQAERAHNVYNETLFYPTVELILKSQYELGSGLEAINTITTYFTSPSGAPIHILRVFLSILDAEEQYSLLIDYLEIILQDQEGLLHPDSHTLLCEILTQSYLKTDEIRRGLVYIAGNQRLAINLPVRAALLDILRKQETILLNNPDASSRTTAATDEVIKNKHSEASQSDSVRHIPQTNTNIFQHQQTQYTTTQKPDKLQMKSATEIHPNMDMVISSSSSNVAQSKHKDILSNSRHSSKKLSKFQSLMHKIVRLFRRLGNKIYILLGLENSKLFGKISHVCTQISHFVWKARFAFMWLIILYYCYPLFQFITRRILYIPQIGYVVNEFAKVMKLAFTLGTGGRL